MQDVVLRVDVHVQVGFERLQVVKQGAVAVPGVLGRL